MTDCITSLPGDIAGLVKQGSPLLVDGCQTCAVLLHDGKVAYATQGRLSVLPLTAVMLDLTVSTGRWNAAAYVIRTKSGESYDVLDNVGLLNKALRDEDMELDEIERLAWLVLDVAGREAK